jgi:hypothetical protein
MRQRTALWLTILLGLTVGLWLSSRPAKRTEAPPIPAPPATRSADNSKPPDTALPDRDGNVREPSPPAPSPTARLTTPESAPQKAPLPIAPPVPPPTPAAPLTPQSERQLIEQLENVRLMIRDYRTALGENPVGTNAEIMRAITGHNAKQVNIGPPSGQSLNANGELVDQWGTPYFFHQLSGREMEIHSAGPDRVMGTPDDRQVK